MVHCCVPGCINHSSKTCNISYHRIPNDKGLQKAWLARIRRDNAPINVNPVGGGGGECGQGVGI